MWQQLQAPLWALLQELPLPPSWQGALSLRGGLGSQLSLLPPRAPSRSCPMAAAGNVSVGLGRVGPAAQAWRGLPLGSLRGGGGRGMVPREPRPLCATPGWTLTLRTSPGVPRKPESLPGAHDDPACLRALEWVAVGKAGGGREGGRRATEGGDPLPASASLPRRPSQ